jgi:hypothetical protein
VLIAVLSHGNHQIHNVDIIWSIGSNRRDGCCHSLLFFESGFSDKNNSVFEGFQCIGAYEELCHPGYNDM